MRGALLVIVVLGAGWYFFRHFEIDGLDGVEIRPKTELAGGGEDDDLRRFLDGGATSVDDATFANAPGTSYSPLDFSTTDTKTPATAVSFGDPAALPAAGDYSLPPEAVTLQPTRRIRVASWALGGFGKQKANKPYVMGLLARVVRTFDVVAIQQITGTERDLLPRIVEHVNRTGRRYDYLIGPPAARDSNPYGPAEQLAFLFDTERVVTDRSQFYTVADPGNLFTHDPIVGWFRAADGKPDRAWTFSVINVRVELEAAASEVAALPSVLNAVLNDGRYEDDCILAGLFQADDAYLVPTIGEQTVTAVVEATPTDIFGKHQVSNLLLTTNPTTEYLGTGGVVNFLRIHNLTLAECEELTPHLPIYAEFSPLEGRE